MSEEPAVAPPRSPLRRLPALIALVTFVSFLPSLRAEFVNWDDDLNFLDNPHYRGFSPANLKWMFTASHSGHWHPLTWITLAVDHAVWGMNPFGYHLTSLLIHACNAALLYAVLGALLRLARRPASEWACAAGALFYAIHPMRVESVAWVTERRDVLCGFFILLTLLFYLRHVGDEREGRPSRKWLALAIAAFAGSLMSKVLGITLPAVLLILDVYPLRRFTRETWKRLLLEKALFALLSVADAVVMLTAAERISALRSTADYDLLARAGQAAYGLCFYLIKTVWPTRLAPLYRYDPAVKATDPVYLASLAAVAALAALLVVRRRQWPGVAAAGGAYAVLVAPTLGIVVTGMQIAADRYTYLALLPAAPLVSDLLMRHAAGKRVAVPAVIVLSLLGVLTFRQTRIWESSETLWTRQIELDPDGMMAYHNRAYARHARGDLPGALADYTIGIQREPAFKPVQNRGIVRALLEDHEGAIADFTLALRLDPRSADAYASRAVSRSKRGDLAGALADCEAARLLAPDSALVYANRGTIRLDAGDLPAALEDFTKALELRPTIAETWRNRGLALFRSGRFAEAVADFSRSLELRPDHVETRVNRAIARSMARDLDGAIQDLDEALRRRPDPATHVSRSLVRAMRGDLDGAIADCSEAIRQNPAFYEGYARRGVARMEKGDSRGATGDLETALRLAPAGWPQRAQIEQFLREARK